MTGSDALPPAAPDPPAAGSAPPRRLRGARAGWAAAWLALLGLLACVHLRHLADVPRGLFVDESSIGLNAALIASQGRDEHDVAFPVFFRAFGEYKNPLYIYGAALVFRLAGVSVWTLRLTSFLFFALLLGGVACLARRLFPGSPSSVLYAVAAGGLLPWFFTVSRIAFEVVAQPAVVAWLLCLVLAVYEAERPRCWLAVLCGAVAGLTIYTYSTARLLTPLFVVTALAVYSPRRYWRRHLLASAGLAAALVPYLLFAAGSPGALTRRFENLTYAFDPALPPSSKAATFLDHYAIYWHPRYLLVEGDFNRRNSTGSTGELHAVVFVLALLGLAGLAGLARRQASSRGRFDLLLAANLLAAPVAAALTSGTSALRSILLGLYLLVFSIFGFERLTRIEHARSRRVLVGGAVLVLALESGRYLAHYFGPYVEESVWAFKSWNFRGALLTALAQRPSRIEISGRGNQPYAHLEFYRRTLDREPAVPLEMAQGRPRAAPGICIVYFNKDAWIPDDELYPSRVWGLDDPTILRCYSRPAERATR
jgi:4-amino-4-deoxy-L-arabinose transferase-like glycosyltransferase